VPIGKDLVSLRLKGWSLNERRFEPRFDNKTALHSVLEPERSPLAIERSIRRERGDFKTGRT